MNRGCCSASAQATTVNSQQIWFCSCPCQEQVAQPGVLDGRIRSLHSADAGGGAPGRRAACAARWCKSG